MSRRHSPSVASVVALLALSLGCATAPRPPASGDGAALRAEALKNPTAAMIDRWTREPLPFPAAADGAPPLTLEAIEAGAAALEPRLGQFPPRLRSDEERLAAYGEWKPLVAAAEGLKGSGPAPERLAVVLATLYRQGHNMEVTGSGRRAVESVEQALQAYPDSVPVHWQAAYLYTQIAPQFAPRGEQALLGLRRLLGTDQHPAAERGLVAAYLMQGKLELARQQAAKALQLAPGDDQLRQIKEALDSGRIRTVNMN